MNSGLKPVQFVPAKANNAEQKNKHTHGEGLSQKNEEEVGRQAREFYESIIASSSYHPSSPPRDGKQPKLNGKKGRLHQKHEATGKGRSQREENNKDAKERSSQRTQNELLRHCQEGNLREVKRLIRKGRARLKDSDQFGWNALMCAAYSGHANIVSYILTRDPSLLEQRNNKGQSALDLARVSGQEKVVRVLQELEQPSTGSLRTRSQSGQVHDGPSQPLWCEVCEAEFRDRKKVHQQSTVHLFSCGHAPNPTLYHIPESNRGFQIMLQDGWDKERGLGKGGEGRKFPIKTILKRDRQGLGAADGDQRPRITHFKPHDTEAVKRPKREKVTKEEDLPKVKDGLSSAGRKQDSERSRHRAMEIDFRRSFNT